jgi:hypothetical protein
LIGGAGDDTLTGAGGRDIFDASVKLEISQLPISWLKAPAPLNIECILVTLILKITTTVRNPICV